MVSVFDLDRLAQLLRDFYGITKIRITVFDENRNELISYPKNVPPLCKLIRSSASGLNACMECDRRACELAAQQKKTRIYRCHAGLTEAVTPLFSHSVLVGYLLFGHVMDYPDMAQGKQAVLRACAHLPAKPEELERACEERPLLDRDFVMSATRVLQAVSYYVILERIAALQDDDLAVRLNRYIEDHLTERMTAESICKELGIGKAQLYKVSNGLYGRGVAQQIRTMRVEQAKKHLREDRRMTIAEVASVCGFGDYNYFITVFTRETGMTPGEFRKTSG